MTTPTKDEIMAARFARVARLREAICACGNREGRHACDIYAERASDAIDQLRRGQEPTGSRWHRIVKVIVKELKADV